MEHELLWEAAVLFLCVFLFTVLIEARLVPFLRRRRAGQPILEIGPAWHLSKAGTPTLGGVGFILAIALALAVLTPWWMQRGDREWQMLLLLFLFAFGCGSIGFFDDWRKLARRQNQGLTAAQKYFLQLAVSGAFLFAAEALLGLDHSISIPFSTLRLELGVFYYPLALIYLTGLVNALNLTDGVDGLLSCVSAVLGAFLLIFGVSFLQQGALFVGILLLGACLGFLCFNAHPAKVFMGDTGSLFLGALVAGYGLLSPTPLGVLAACGVFVTEALSVLLQVLYFKKTHGKRLFRMAPLHHHFEKGGWSENRVVGVFSLVGAAFALLAFLGEVLR